jgi:hypothetical protein
MTRAMMNTKKIWYGYHVFNGCVYKRFISMSQEQFDSIADSIKHIELDDHMKNVYFHKQLTQVSAMFSTKKNYVPLNITQAMFFCGDKEQPSVNTCVFITDK